METIPSIFDVEEEKLLKQTEDLHKALMHLRYEGKLLKDQNIKSVQILTFALDLELEKHWHLQEEIIFPFLRTHIPRHEAAILLLQAEHKEIDKHRESLKRDMMKIPKVPNHFQESKIYEMGIYLVTLIRHHIAVEKKSIDQSLRNELREDEKEVIAKRLEIWLRAN